MDLFHTPSTWTTQPAPDEQQVAANRIAGTGHSPDQSQPVAAALATSALVLALCVGLVWFVMQRPTSRPPTVVAPGPAHLTVAGLYGQVTLIEHPDGRTWLSWWRHNRSWAGPPIWTDKPYEDFASCAAFVRTIICVNFDPKVRHSVWQLTPVLLGRTAMLKAGLLPDSSSQPAPIVAQYMAQLRAKGVDVWYRFGAIQSPMLVVGNTAVQYFQRVRLEWPAGSQDPGDIRLAPLGQEGLESGW
jgi:hypothetical protein